MKLRIRLDREMSEDEDLLRDIMAEDDSLTQAGAVIKQIAREFEWCPEDDLILELAPETYHYEEQSGHYTIEGEIECVDCSWLHIKEQLDLAYANGVAGTYSVLS